MHEGYTENMQFNNRFIKLHNKKKKKKKKRSILTLVTLHKVALGVTWQIIKIIMLIKNILNLSLVSCILAPDKHQKKKN